MTERKCRREQKKTLAHTKPSEARRTLREMSSKIAQARRLIILRTPRVSSSILYTQRPKKHSGSGDSLPLPLPRLHTLERDVQLGRTTAALQRPQIARLYRFYYYPRRA
uniref:Uncharacterized protein n=1 Tax=Trichogramma kaykai TaxID=54128 RepID=A0ABD2W4P3_9HYME